MLPRRLWALGTEVLLWEVPIKEPCFALALRFWLAWRERLAGPTNGSDNGYLLFTRMPAGAHGPALFTLPDDHLFIVLEGKMTIQIGTDKFVVNKFEGVQVPPNTPQQEMQF